MSATRPLGALLLVLLALAPARGQEMQPNGGMEPPYIEGLAQGWTRNCYGVNDSVFAPEERERWDGRAAQRITCTRFVDGGVQFHSTGLSVAQGQTYTLRVWLKGTVKQPVYVGIRKHGAPYTPYLKRDVRVTPRWRPYVITGPSIGTDPDCGIYIMFAGTGTLLVDGVSLVPGAADVPEDTRTPPRKGNRVYNAGFEAGPEGWAPAGGFALQDAAAHSGTTGAALPGGALECRPFTVRAGLRYTLTAWVRSAGGPVRCTLRLREWADNGGDFPADRHEISADMPVGPEWTRCRVSGVALPNLWDGYVARVEAFGPVQVDDVQVEEGGETPYAPAHPVEVGAWIDTRWCHPGDAVAVRTCVAAPPGVRPKALVYTLEDTWSRPVGRWRRATGAQDALTVRAPKPGLYRVRVTAPGAAGGEAWFGVFARGTVRNRAFGTHVTATVPQPGPAVRMAEAMGVGWVRLHDFGDFVHWYRVEPKKGRWTWYDAEVDDLRRRGFDIIGNLGHPPLWAGRSDPRRQDNGPWTNAPPRDLAEWEDYVYRTVSHYRGRIRHWEVWNEPYWVGFFCGTPADYADLLRTAHRAVKRADPEAMVIGGCFSTVGDEWTRGVLKQGALQWMDVVSYHVYWTPSAAESARPGEMPLLEQQARRLAATIREYGPARPLWMTEGGVASPPFVSWLPPGGIYGPSFAAGAGKFIRGMEAAGALVKALVEMRAAGVAVACYYYTGAHVGGGPPWFSSIGNGAYVLMDFDARPKPTALAYAALARLLQDARPATVVAPPGLRAYVFAQGGGSVAVAWSARACALTVKEAQMLDMFGAPLGRGHLRPGEPVFVRAPRLSPASLARLLRAEGRP